MGSDKVCEGLLNASFSSNLILNILIKCILIKKRLICKQQRAMTKTRAYFCLTFVVYLCLETVRYFAIHQQLDRIIAKISDRAKLLLVVAFSVISLKKVHEKGD